MTGPAIIRDRRGRTYVASSAQLVGDQAVTFQGRLLVRTIVGEHRYPEKLRTLPLRDVEIDWLETERDQVAA